jgi:hypothetical protein
MLSISQRRLTRLGQDHVDDLMALGSTRVYSCGMHADAVASSRLGESFMIATSLQSAHNLSCITNATDFQHIRVYPCKPEYFTPIGQLRPPARHAPHRGTRRQFLRTAVRSFVDSPAVGVHNMKRGDAVCEGVCHTCAACLGRLPARPRGRTSPRRVPRPCAAHVGNSFLGAPSVLLAATIGTA